MPYLVTCIHVGYAASGASPHSASAAAAAAACAPCLHARYPHCRSAPVPLPAPNPFATPAPLLPPTQIPGQCIGVRLPAPSTSGGNGPAAEQPPAQGLPKQLYNIATSPYASRRDSAYVDASLIEVRQSPIPTMQVFIGLCAALGQEARQG